MTEPLIKGKVSSAEQNGEYGRNLQTSSTVLQRVGSCIFYAACSFLIMIVNKNVLTTYGFPSYQVLGLAQMVSTVVILHVGKLVHLIEFPSINSGLIFNIYPLSLIYFGNLVFGLGGTQELSLPMLTVLRRFGILMTMIGEVLVLRARPTFTIQASVFLMILGNVIATVDDLAFNLTGYIFVLINDFFTTANGIITKLKLNTNELGKYDLLYYNSLFMLVPAVLLAWIMGDFELVYNYTRWTDVMFLLNFTLSGVMGFLLMYSTLLCTLHNSPLTQAVVGVLKNIFITYFGMVMMTDYKYSLVNFVGINISMLASLLYTWVIFIQKQSSSRPLPAGSKVNLI